MSVSSLLPVAGAAIGGVAMGTWNRLRAVPSFLPSLAEPDSATGGAEAAEDSSGRTARDASAVADDGGQRLERLRDELAEFARQLRERLAAAGIDTSVPIELKSDGQGGVIVDDPHPQRAEIERLIAADPDLATTFHYLAAMASSDESLRGPAGDWGWGEFRLRLVGGGEQVRFE